MDGQAGGLRRQMRRGAIHANGKPRVVHLRYGETEGAQLIFRLRLERDAARRAGANRRNIGNDRESEGIHSRPGSLDRLLPKEAVERKQPQREPEGPRKRTARDSVTRVTASHNL